MNECKRLYSLDEIRSLTIETIIGLLLFAGLLPSEPINLTIADADIDQGILHVRKTKFAKERYVPLDISVTQKLRGRG